MAVATASRVPHTTATAITARTYSTRTDRTGTSGCRSAPRPLSAATIATAASKPLHLLRMRRLIRSRAISSRWHSSCGPFWVELRPHDACGADDFVAAWAVVLDGRVAAVGGHVGDAAVVC